MHEYKVMASNTPISGEQLEDMSIDRWELITIVYHQNSMYLTYFRRKRVIQ